MAITWRARPSGVIEVVFSEPYTLPESEQAMKEVYAQPGLGRPLRFLVDVRHSTPPDTEFVTSAVMFWQLHVSDMWKAKVAVVVASERQYGMAQMSERTAASRELPFTVRVFKESEWDEVERWLEDKPE